ncbi:MAG: RNA-metabolising metallo-beta-lactamase [Parcubacteria group bacterium GW2011_GWA2_47_10]|nr:MAG: RNA-metabolising metallo-beta-lactamase [Parcubacteria group bacterium GW2011_GWA2_47_10]
MIKQFHSGRPPRKGRRHSPHKRQIRWNPSAQTSGDGFDKSRLPRENLKVVPLGGLEEIGRNMCFIEYGDDIIIIDMGLQFPEEGMPGIDYIIPNISYLKEHKDRIRGVIITHAHLDHIGAIPYLIHELGNPTIFTMPLTRAIILRRQEDFKHLPPIDIETIKSDEVLNLGSSFRIEFFHVNHNIPDTIGVAVKTPVGTVVHTADFKFDNNPVGDKPADYAKMAHLSSEGVLLLLSDSTGAERPGHSISEKTIQENLEDIFEHSDGRIIAATFGSLISRIQQLIVLAEKFDRRVAIDGYSMKANVAIGQELGYIKIKKGTLVDIDQISDYPENRQLICCTGAQGESNAVLMRIAQKEHRFIRLEKGDTVIFSSSVVPGNERTVQSLKDIIYRQGANVYHYQMMDIHAGGHAQAEDLKMMINLIRPKFFMPIHGNYFLLKLHANLAESVGIPPENVIIAGNGNIVELTKDKATILKKTIPASYVMVDGLGVGDVGEVVLRDRQMLSQDGIFVIIAIIDSKSGKIIGSPDIISRGFIYLRENQELLKEARHKIREIVEHSSTPEMTLDPDYIKNSLRDKIGQFLFTKTERRPMVLPVIIKV